MCTEPVTTTDYFIMLVGASENQALILLYHVCATNLNNIIIHIMVQCGQMLSSMLHSNGSHHLSSAPPKWQQNALKVIGWRVTNT